VWCVRVVCVRCVCLWDSRRRQGVTRRASRYRHMAASTGGKQARARVAWPCFMVTACKGLPPP
jgi:hypothetical protein